MEDGMKFNVALFKVGRISFKGVEAPNHLQAAAEATKLPHCAADMEDAEELLSAVVDVVGDEEYLDTRDVSFVPTESEGGITLLHLMSMLKILGDKPLTPDEHRSVEQTRAHIARLEQETAKLKAAGF
jgi:hypothetical protein